MERQGSIVDLNAVNLRILLETASKRSYRSYDEDSINWNVVRQCQALFDKDYECEIVSNKYGELCGHYPSRMIVPVRERSMTEDSASAQPRPVFQPNSNLIDLMKEARLARCRCRLVCPVILLDGKYVCRSATVAGLPEVYGRSGLQFLTRKLGGASATSSQNGAQQSESGVIATSRRSSDPETSEYDIVSLSDAQPSSPAKNSVENATDDVTSKVDPSASKDSAQPKQSLSAITAEPRTVQEPMVAADRESRTGDSRKAVARQNIGEKIRWPYVDQLRDADCHLLKTLHVGTIYDLMLQRRKRKLFFSLTTSEKADGEDSVYATNFNIVAVPFPGREFFAEWRARDYVADSLRYDWHADPEVDVSVSVPPTVNAFLSRSRTIDWNVYENWNMVDLTRNYFASMLATQVRSDGGILVHCISGWDRTPLFVSLLRLSLWADRVVHPSLDAEQITFLSLAYDWYLFGHALNERLHYGEEILFFGFQFLQFIADDSFSYYTLAESHLKDQHQQRVRPQPGERAARLNAVRELFTDLYTTVTLSSSVSESSSPRNETDAEADEAEHDGNGHEENANQDPPVVPDATDGTSTVNRLQASMPAVSNAVTGALGWAQRFVSNLYN